MRKSRSHPGAFWMALTVAGALTGIFLVGATAASAAGCPAGKEVSDSKINGPSAHTGVKEELLGAIDLAKEKVNVPGRLFRMRRLVIEPGGEVAMHSHEDRPALIYTISGTITEYSTHCSVPIVHKEGDLSIEQAGLSHWWKNTGKKPVTLISADIAQNPNEHGM
jgi:quercetin dioxygenase-like cupin family protein